MAAEAMIAEVQRLRAEVNVINESLAKPSRNKLR